MTTRGRVTIPKEVRERLKLRAGSKVDFTIDESGGVGLKPLDWEWRSILGILKSRRKKPMTIREMDKAIARGVLAKIRKDK